MTRVAQLRVDGIRNLQNVSITPGAGVNVFSGPNGAGKTSLLEALHCLSRGRSFLGSGRHEYLNRQQRKAMIVAHLEDDNRDSARVLGLEREAGTWSAKAGGQPLKALSELAQELPVCVFHPGLHRLVEGNPEDRRRFLDFGVFHVEPRFYHHWRHYRHALKQRNAAIRMGESLSAITAWDPLLIAHGQAMADARARHLAEIARLAKDHLEEFAPDLVGVNIHLASGWPEDQGFAETLNSVFSQDQDQGFTTRGPHRADIRLVLAGQKVAGRLSRGQQKMLALALLLAQAQAMTGEGRVPIMAFDDLPSELDIRHQALILERVRTMNAQTWITGNSQPDSFQTGSTDRVFHVEQGAVTELV